MSKSLTKMGRVSNNQDFLKSVFQEMKEQHELKKNNNSCFGVYTICTRWICKGYINSSGIMYFNSEHDAIEYLDKWIASGKGYAKLLSPKY